MNIPLIVGLSISFLLGGGELSKYMSSTDKRIHSASFSRSNIFKSEISRSLSNRINVFVDGNNKVYLNDLDNVEPVEDIWVSNEVKTIRIEGDLKDLDPQSKYLTIKMPVGMELKMNPQSLVDNKSIIDVDLSNFKKDYISSTNTSKNHNPSSGTITYKINPQVASISLDILVGVDELLWNTIDGVLATSSNNNALEVYFGDKDTFCGKKLDTVKVNGRTWKSYYHPTFEPNVIQGGTNKLSALMSLDFIQTPINRLYKKIETKIDIPYTEYQDENGIIQKKYVDVSNIYVNNAGTYKIEDNKIYFEWKDVYISSLEYKVDFDFPEDRFSSGDVVKFSSGDLLVEDYFSGNMHVAYPKYESKITVVSNTEENLNIFTSNRPVYMDSSSHANKVTKYMGGFRIRNYGIDTGKKRISLKFPDSGIGITTVNLPTPIDEGTYNIKVKAVDIKTGESLSLVKTIDKPKEHHIYTGYRFARSILKSDFPDRNIDNIYIQELEYEVNSFENKYISYSLSGQEGTNSSGNMYGIVLDNATPNTGYITSVTISDVDEITGKSINSVIHEIKSTVINRDSKSTAGVTSYEFKGESGGVIKEVMAGDKFLLEGDIETAGYPYYNTTYLSEPIIYLRLPKGITINEAGTSFTWHRAGYPDKIVNFNIVNKDNPRKLNDGTLLYKIEFNEADFGIGYFSENLTSLALIKYSIQLDTLKSIRTSAFNIKNSIFVGDENIETLGSGTWSGYFVQDIWDINNNGKTTDEVATTKFDKTISIVANTSWLDVDSLEENKKPVTIDTSTDENPIRFGFEINNNNDGVVKSEKLEYFVPIPKKGLAYNQYVKDLDEEFNFDMVLTEKVEPIEGFSVLYSYDNDTFKEYSNDLDLAKVSMVKFVNQKDIYPNDRLQIGVQMKYLDGSWNGEGNDNIWSIYGYQTYEKNGSESSFLHVLDRFKVEIVFEPKITRNPEDKTVNVGENVSFDSSLDVGIPVATGKWQYKTTSSGNWIDLTESSTTLTLNNVSYNMNGYQYRYVASNKGATVESTPAILTVIDNVAPEISLKEFKEGNDYKIKIMATDIGSGVSHIILPDGSRVNSDAYTLTVEPNREYTFKVYDLAGNESSRSTQVLVFIKNTATSNLDVYIKSENMLSVSLNTNSVTFDDFSGVEDMEKQNAIKLTIDSSLPYQVNSYLNTELQNPDKSSVMDKDILNIKSNNESAYKSFDNTANPIVILDNQASGNSVSHGIDLMLKGGIAHQKDIYKTTIKLEVEQK